MTVIAQRVTAIAVGQDFDRYGLILKLQPDPDSDPDLIR